MAELSTLSPSPPALGDHHNAPSISSVVPQSTGDAPASLSNESALTGNAVHSGGPASIPQPPLSPSKLLADPPSEQKAAPRTEAPTGATAEPMIENREMEHSSEPAAQMEAKQSSPSPDPNPGPILYPDVHVTHNPTPAMEESSSSSTCHLPHTPAPSESSGEKPQPPQQAQSTQAPPSSPPKPQNTVEGKKDELPSTPIKVDPPSPSVPLIQEPLPAPSEHNAQPAPDSLSYLESASLLSGTLESLTGLGEDGSSVGSDSEINGPSFRRTDKYGFLGGSQYSEGSEREIRVEVARQRELKWLDMFNNWDKWMKHRFQKVKMRCRKGIPSSLRSRAWQLLSNSHELLEANRGKFEELVREPGEAKWLDIIEKDLHRQFPFHEMFVNRGGHGQEDLCRILKAYTIYRPDEGYCQAQAPVAAVLLMHMPAEQAFWCLVQICEKFLPGYYSAGLEAIQLDGEIFFSLLRRTCPMAYNHLKKYKIDPILYMTEWFMCIFSRTLPWASVLRVWDMFFCEGVKIVFRVGLVLLKQMLGSADKRQELQGMYETMERLRSISPDSIREDSLVQEIVLLPVTEALIDRECNIQVRKWRESRGELTHQPGRRRHGARAIFEEKRRAASISSGGSFSFLATSTPPPGPLRASSSLLSLPGFRRSRNPFQTKKGSFSGPSGIEAHPPRSPPTVTHSPGRVSNKPPIPPGAGQKQVQSPLAGNAAEAQQAPVQTTQSPPTETSTPPSTLSPSPLVVSEQIMPAIPSPTANNTPLPPLPDTKNQAAAVEAAAAAAAAAAEPPSAEEEGKKKKKSKDEKKKEKEDEKKKLKEKKEKEKAEKLEKERLKKEKERQEKKKGSRKKDKGAGDMEEKNGAAAPKDSA
ncbi:TBC1 domain family member 10B [Synchiropus picturatus]